MAVRIDFDDSAPEWLRTSRVGKRLRSAGFSMPNCEVEFCYNEDGATPMSTQEVLLRYNLLTATAGMEDCHEIVRAWRQHMRDGQLMLDVLHFAEYLGVETARKRMHSIIAYAIYKRYIFDYTTVAAPEPADAAASGAAAESSRSVSLPSGTTAAPGESPTAVSASR